MATAMVAGTDRDAAMAMGTDGVEAPMGSGTRLENPPTWHRRLRQELRRHAPYTGIGAVGGLALAFLLVHVATSRQLSRTLFEIAHPLHVLLSAVATTNLYARRQQGKRLVSLLLGYVGSIGIATLSDSIVPYLGEWLLQLPARAAHLGFVENAWRVHLAAVLGATLGLVLPKTPIPHGGHVFLSTCASLFHMLMALEGPLTFARLGVMGGFLFLAVWLPCCTSDIVLPMILPGPRQGKPPLREPRGLGKSDKELPRGFEHLHPRGGGS